VRQLTCSIIQSLFTFYSQLPQQNVLTMVGSGNNNNASGSGERDASSSEYAQYNTRKLQIAELLSDLLEDCCAVSNIGDACLDYLTLLKLVIGDKDCKYRLVLKLNILGKLETLLHKEIRYLSELERMSESTNANNTVYIPACNLSLGYSVRMLTELLALFLKEQNIKNKFKHRLVATVLNSYLSLKRLVFQRTRLVEDAQEKLLACLEQMTSGTELEQRKFMHICIQTVCNFDLDDLVTPVFIFERLCQLIYPDETVDNKEFLLILEKDPNQEDYLQGRMLGNPYSSAEPGLGPLMRNVKNKICMDCELLALLDDDNGMELLVNNKIISLDLAVKDVHKKVIFFFTFFNIFSSNIHLHEYSQLLI
jgi:E3 ubiquitin-protein ligase UBR4